MEVSKRSNRRLVCLCQFYRKRRCGQPPHFPAPTARANTKKKIPPKSTSNKLIRAIFAMLTNFGLRVYCEVQTSFYLVSIIFECKQWKFGVASFLRGLNKHFYCLSTERVFWCAISSVFKSFRAFDWSIKLSSFRTTGCLQWGSSYAREYLNNDLAK